jgi:hypothetical protein
MIELLTQIADLFGASRYLAHSLCLSNDPVVVPLFAVSDIIIGFSYYLIAFALWYSINQKARIIKLALIILSDTKIVRLTWLFIVFCGTTHFANVATLYQGVYYILLLTLVATATVSLSAAFQIALILLRGQRDSDALDILTGAPVPNYTGRPLPLHNPAVSRLAQRGAGADASQAE